MKATGRPLRWHLDGFRSLALQQGRFPSRQGRTPAESRPASEGCRLKSARTALRDRLRIAKPNTSVAWASPPGFNQSVSARRRTSSLSARLPIAISYRQAEYCPFGMSCRLSVGMDNSPASSKRSPFRIHTRCFGSGARCARSIFLSPSMAARVGPTRRTSPRKATTSRNVDLPLAFGPTST